MYILIALHSRTTYLYPFLNQFLQERSSLGTLQAICCQVINGLLVLTHVLNIIIEAYQLFFTLGREKSQQWGNALVVSGVFDTSQLQKFTKILPEFFVILDIKIVPLLNASRKNTKGKNALISSYLFVLTFRKILNHVKCFSY